MFNSDFHSKERLEYIRQQAKSKFEQIRETMIDLGLWTIPHRMKWLLSQTPGVRNNRHIIDPTHILALNSCVSGFLEGNTSVSRPWFKYGTRNRERDLVPENREWLDMLTRSALRYAMNSNYYNAASEFYYDYHSLGTGAHYISERQDTNLPHFHTLTPGSYYPLNNAYGEPVVLVTECAMSVKALVEEYGVRENGKWVWDNISSSTRKMYEEANYTQMVEVVRVIEFNQDFDTSQPIGGRNRRWISRTYERGVGKSFVNNPEIDMTPYDSKDKDRYLRISYSQRKPFIVGKTFSNMGFEYGETGATFTALGAIKSLNKKAIGKDMALDQMLKPTIQGPSNLKKSYISTSPGRYIPLDAMSMSKGGLRQVYEINPAIGAVIQDVGDLRQQIERAYYADFLLYLSLNPKTRTATETDAIMGERQMVIGPVLQSLNWSYNLPLVEYFADYALENDPDLPPPPPDLEGEFIRPEFISVFAQAQRAADLPGVERYLAFVGQVGQLDPSIFDKVDVDKVADIFDDRLYLPPGINRPQAEVEARREQAAMMARRDAELEQLTQVAGAAKDLGVSAQPGGQR